MSGDILHGAPLWTIFSCRQNTNQCCVIRFYMPATAVQNGAQRRDNQRDTGWEPSTCDDAADFGAQDGARKLCSMLFWSGDEDPIWRS